jgi:hypothetical protein
MVQLTASHNFDGPPAAAHVAPACVSPRCDTRQSRRLKVKSVEVELEAKSESGPLPFAGRATAQSSRRHSAIWRRHFSLIFNVAVVDGHGMVGYEKFRWRPGRVGQKPDALGPDGAVEIAEPYHESQDPFSICIF